MSARAAVFVLLVAAAKAGSPDFDLNELNNELAEADAVPTYGHHLRRSHTLPALVKYGHNVHHNHHVSLDTSLEDTLELEGQTGVEDMDAPGLPGRHPSVEKALDGMAGDLETLSEKKEQAKEVRNELEGTMTDAVHHMNDVNSIKHAITKQETQLRIEGGKLETLKVDEGRLEETRGSLVASLKRMLEPKIMFAHEREQKKLVVLRKEEEAARAWKTKRDSLKVSAMELIKQKKVSYQGLLDAEEEVARAQKKAEMARITYEHDRTTTGEQVQSYRYAETRYTAEAQHEKAAKAAAMAAKHSVENLYNVEHVEKEKVDQSILYRKDRLRKKIHEVEEVRNKAHRELKELEQKYHEWQESQRERTAEVVKKSQETAEAQSAFAARQQQVLDTAQAKVTRDAQGPGDWDAWGGDAGMFTKVDDELDE